MVLDTHAIIWYLLEPARMPSLTLGLIRRAVREGNAIFVSAISILELVYLVEKGRMPELALTRLLEGISVSDTGVVCVPFDHHIAVTARKIHRDQVPDMPDRIIAATARHLGVPLITRDRRIQAADVETIW